jgi:predicted transcriptional regulator
LSTRPGTPRKKINPLNRSAPGSPTAERSVKQEKVMEAIDGALEQLPIPLPEGLSGSQSTIVLRNLAPQVCQLAFSGFPNRRIAARLGLSEDAVDRYVKSDHYAAVYEQQVPMMLEKVDEAIVDRLSGVVLEAVDDLISMRSNERTPMMLRRRLNLDLIELHANLSGGKKKNVASDMLTKIHQRVVEDKKDGSRVRTETITTVLPPGDDKNTAAGSGFAGSNPSPSKVGGD